MNGEYRMDLIARSKDGSIENVIGELVVPFKLTVTTIATATTASAKPVDTEINLFNGGWIS